MKAGWQTTTLGDACRFIDYRGRTPEKTESGLRLITAKNVKMGFLQMEPLEFVAPDIYESWMTCGIPKIGDVLFTTEAPLANVAQLGTSEKVVFAQRIIVFQPYQANLDRTFLKYLLLSDATQQRIHEKGTGATVQGIKASLLKAIEISYPPLPEQKRIVGVLDEAFDSIATAKANAEQNRQNARALFESHLQSVFTQRGEGWVEMREPLSELCELIVDCEHKTAPTQEEGIPSIRTPNIGKGKLLLEGVYRVLESTYKEWTRRAIPSAGDLILAREAPAGNVAVIPENLPLCLGQRTVLIRPRKNLFDSQFLAMLLLQPQMQQKLLDHSRGATVQHVNMKDIRALNIGAIPPLSVQHRIVSKANSFSLENEKLISIYQQKLVALDELKKSLLHQTFTGQL